MANQKQIEKLLPIVEWLPKYKRNYLASDIKSGLIIGILLIPQGMAYAMIAGLPPVFGLYASLVPQLIYFLTGTSRQLSVGPVATDSLLVAAGLGALSISSIENYIDMAILLALMVGVFQLLLGLFKMGFIVNYLSKPVISGFTSAVAIIISISQLKHLFGISVVQSNKAHLVFADIVSKLPTINWTTFLLGASSILILLLFKTISPKTPRALIVVILGIAAVVGFQLNQLGVHIVGEIPSGLPAFQMPTVSVSNLQNLFPIAATLALIAFMEASSISKAIEEKNKENLVRPNQELVALGLSNIVGSFFQAYPTTGGFSRTAVNVQSGAKTTLSSLIAFIVIGVTLLFLTSWFFYLPLAVLASIIIVAVIGLIDLKLPKALFKTQKMELALLVITFLITLLVGIKEGIIGGVILSLMYTIYRLSKPHVAVLGQVKGTDYFRNIDRFGEDVEAISNTKIIRFDSPIFFGNKDFFRTIIKKEIDKSPNTITHLVLDAESINYIDSSGLSMLSKLIQELKEDNISLYITNAIGPVRDSLYTSDIVADLGENRVFADIIDAIQFINGALQQSIIQKKIANQTSFEVRKIKTKL